MTKTSPFHKILLEVGELRIVVNDLRATIDGRKLAGFDAFMAKLLYKEKKHNKN